jgi:hypothetical protein
MSDLNGKDRVVFLAVPNAGSIMPCCLNGISQATRKHKLMLVPSQFGDVPHNFNLCWSIALNIREAQSITHFAMIHTDISPGQWWLDTLIEEMDRVDADVMSAVNAIKDARGLTTTGLRYPGIWGTRRFTMTEVMELPETFSVADTEEPEAILAINTGCWVCRFPWGWPDRFPGFKSEHRIVFREGQAQPEFDSEDWLFSDWAASQGLRVYATRKVNTKHVGAFEFGNDTVWGSLKTDEFRPYYPAMEMRRVETEEALAG